MKNTSRSRIRIHFSYRALLVTVLASVIMATRASLSRSIQLQPVSLLRPSITSRCRSTLTYPKQILKSRPCPLWSSSFSLCLRTLPYKSIISRSTTTIRSLSANSTLSESCPTMSTAAHDNPLLKDFDFPPFDAIEASHVRPGIRAILKELEDQLAALEKTAEPSWPKLAEPLEKIIDRLSVTWGAVNHLKSVKDTPELRAAIEEVQPEKVEFDLKLSQSKPIYNAFKAIKESREYVALSEARKRIVESSIKEAVLSGISLEDDKREQYNKIQQA